METGEAFSLISTAIEAGRAANGYLIVGDIRRDGRELVEKILLKLYPDESERVASRSHPDIVELEPEGKSRMITVDSMREKIVEPMSLASFSGGWKVGIIYGADRLNPQSSNAFLKCLEEPTEKTLYLLLTDRPDALLPTIVSRSQRVDLKPPHGLLEGEGRARVEAAVLSLKRTDGLYAKSRVADELVEILDELKEEASSEEVQIVKASFFKTIMALARKWLVRGDLPLAEAFNNIDAVEQAYRRSERSINDAAVISFMLDRMRVP